MNEQQRERALTQIEILGKMLEDYVCAPLKKLQKLDQPSEEQIKAAVAELHRRTREWQAENVKLGFFTRDAEMAQRFIDIRDEFERNGAALKDMTPEQHAAFQAECERRLREMQEQRRIRKMLDGGPEWEPEPA
jgi:hypothetical protein